MKVNRIPKERIESSQDKLRRQRKQKQLYKTNRTNSKRQHKVAKKTKRHNNAPTLTHDQSETSRKRNIQIRKSQRQAIEDGTLRTTFNVVPDELSG